MLSIISCRNDDDLYHLEVMVALELNSTEYLSLKFAQKHCIVMTDVSEGRQMYPAKNILHHKH